MWQFVKYMRSEGKTIFLTTHYMEEAEELCDRVGVIDHGKIIALGTPENPVGSLGAESQGNTISAPKERHVDALI